MIKTAPPAASQTKHITSTVFLQLMFQNVGQVTIHRSLLVSSISCYIVHQAEKEEKRHLTLKCHQLIQLLFFVISLACQMWKENIHCPFIVTAVEVFQWQRWGRHRFELKLKTKRKQIVTVLYITTFTTVPQSPSAQVLPLHVCVLR